MLEIRAAGQKEAKLIADLSRQTFFESFAPFNSAEDMQLFLDKQFTRELLILEPSMPNNYFFIAWNNEEPLGYMRLRNNQPIKPAELPAVPALELCRFYAVTKAIGTGVGKAMMTYALDFAATLGNKWIWLGVWEKNDRAIRFYEKWGFKKMGTHVFILGTDRQTDWIMAKKL